VYCCYLQVRKGSDSCYGSDSSNDSGDAQNQKQLDVGNPQWNSAGCSFVWCVGILVYAAVYEMRMIELDVFSDATTKSMPLYRLWGISISSYLYTQLPVTCPCILWCPIFFLVSYVTYGINTRYKVFQHGYVLVLVNDFIQLILIGYFSTCTFFSVLESWSSNQHPNFFMTFGQNIHLSSSKLGSST
jgi:hypothetical protein